MSENELEVTDRFAALAAWFAQQNPPGQSALKYRPITYSTAYQQMISDLQTHHLLDNSLPVLPLSTADMDNWVTGLLQAWAMVVDVITFYEERIANEGFIRTAIERRSVVELAHAVGYQPRPGAAAGTYLAFTVRDASGDGTTRVQVPAGTAVQSVPAQGQSGSGTREPAAPQLPQVFETQEAIEARAAWNSLGLASQVGLKWSDIRPDATALRLDGVKTGLHVGDALLILGSSVDKNLSDRSWLLATLLSVEPDAAAGCTTVTFEPRASQNTGSAPFSNPSVYALRSKTGLHGYDQGGVHFTAYDPVHWSPASLGLPNEPVHALLMTGGGVLFAGTDSSIYRSLNNGETWDEASSGLKKGAIYSLASTDNGAIYCGNDKGQIFISLDGGDTWKPLGTRPAAALLGLGALFNFKKAPTPLPQSPVRGLLVYQESGRQRLAAAVDKGVFVSDDGGVSWEPASLSDQKPGTPVGSAWTLVSSQNRWQRLAGTDQGVFPLTPANRINPVVAGIGALVFAAVLYLLLELNGPLEIAFSWPVIGSLLYRYVALLPGVQFAIRVGLAVAVLVCLGLMAAGIVSVVRRALFHVTLLGFPAMAVASTPDNALFAGTRGGVFRWDDTRKRWSSVNTGLLKQIFILSDMGVPPALDKRIMPVSLREAFSQNNVNLSASASVQVVATGASWLVTDPDSHITYALQLEESALAVKSPYDIRALTLGPLSSLYAASQDGHVFRSQDGGQTWSDSNQNLLAGEVDTLMVTSGGLFAGGMPAGNDLDPQWASFTLRSQRLDLDKVYPAIPAGGWAVLCQDDRAALYQVNGVTVQSGKNGRKIGSFTSLQIDRVGDLDTFDRLLSQVYVQSEALAQFDDTPVTGDRLVLDQFVAGFSAGQFVVLSGKRARVKLGGLATGAMLSSPDGLIQIPVSEGENLLVIAPPVNGPLVTGQPPIQVWLLQNRDGQIGQISLQPGQAILVPAEKADEIISEVVTLSDVDGQVPTTLVLSEPLQALYDRSTVRLSGNVVYATHGQTITSEILGGTDRTVLHPTFYLKNKPLTYVLDAGPGGIESTLVVQVNRVKWQAVPALNDLAGDQRAYVVRQDANDRTYILFGDGIHGARLPSGTNNVTASYRVGLGEAGNLPPNSLTTLRTRPAGVSGVTNPVAASGGADPEPNDQVRMNAPRQARNLNRLVSLKDYQDFARTFAGLEKAQAVGLWFRHSRWLHLTIAGQNGTNVEADSNLFQILQQSILDLRATSTQPFQIDSYTPLYFHVQARLIQEASDGQTTDELVGAARRALADAFSFENRDFGQPAAAAEVIAILQNVTGVHAVELERFFIHGQSPVINSVLTAWPARVEGGKILPAELLVIDSVSSDGILLTIKPLKESQ